MVRAKRRANTRAAPPLGVREGRGGGREPSARADGGLICCRGTYSAADRAHRPTSVKTGMGRRSARRRQTVARGAARARRGRHHERSRGVRAPRRVCTRRHRGRDRRNGPADRAGGGEDELWLVQVPGDVNPADFQGCASSSRARARARTWPRSRREVRRRAISPTIISPGPMDSPPSALLELNSRATASATDPPPSFPPSPIRRQKVSTGRGGRERGVGDVRPPSHQARWELEG